MTETNLAQAEADTLIAIEKHRVNEELSDFPADGEAVVLPLQSVDRREQFLLDLSRGRIDLRKVKMQNRGAPSHCSRAARSGRSATPQPGWRGNSGSASTCVPGRLRGQMGRPSTGGLFRQS